MNPHESASTPKMCEISNSARVLSFSLRRIFLLFRVVLIARIVRTGVVLPRSKADPAKLVFARGILASHCGGAKTNECRLQRKGRRRKFNIDKSSAQGGQVRKESEQGRNARGCGKDENALWLHPPFFSIDVLHFGHAFVFETNQLYLQ